MRKFAKILAVVIVIVLLFLFSSPTRAIKVGALMQGCEFAEVISAEFEKENETNPNSWGDKYVTDSSLLDKTTGSGHSAWYVYRIVFIYIPQWAGNG